VSVLEKSLTWAEIDLDAIAHNVRGIKEHVGPQVQVMAVVKADGYGHGAEQVARVALQSGASRLAVNRAVEGGALRQAGLTAPILILGYTLPADAADIVRWELTPTVTTVEGALALASAARAAGKTVPIHVKVDTGMGRFGLLPEETLDFVRRVAELPGLRLEGLYTHYPVADEADTSYTRQQLAIYRSVLQALEDAGFSIPLRHTANSAATLALPETHLDAVRPGIAIYGLPPSDQVEAPIPLRPALTLKSRVARLRTLPAGASIGYGRTYTVPHPKPFALVPIGYGDGYLRLASNRGVMLIQGRRVPIVGRVSMDQTVVDVGDIPGVRQNEEVVVIGRQGGEEITAGEVARWTETIHYEVVTRIAPRVTRVYLQDGQVVATKFFTNSARFGLRFPSTSSL
jgi:alanine racemase